MGNVSLSEVVGAPSILALALCLGILLVVRLAPLSQSVRYRLIAIAPAALIALATYHLFDWRSVPERTGHIIIIAFAFGFSLHAIRMRDWLGQLFGVFCGLWSGLYSLWYAIDVMAGVHFIFPQVNNFFFVLAVVSWAFVLGVLIIAMFFVPPPVYPDRSWRLWWRWRVRRTRFAGSRPLDLTTDH